MNPPMNDHEISRRLALTYRSVKLLPYDDIGTIRSGRAWFDRYMVFPWERSGFEAVPNAIGIPRYEGSPRSIDGSRRPDGGESAHTEAAQYPLESTAQAEARDSAQR